MNRIRLALPLLCLIVGCTPVTGEPAAGQKDEPSLSDLSWLAGSWVGEQDGTQMEELWMPPKGGLMLGLHRDVFASGKSFFEYLRIEAGPQGIVYLASPAGRPATPFRLIETGEQRAVFSNPEHDFPQRILYWIEDRTLHARIEGDTPDGVKSSEWTYRLADSTS